MPDVITSYERFSGSIVLKRVKAYLQQFEKKINQNEKESKVFYSKSQSSFYL